MIRGVVSGEEDPTWFWREVVMVGERGGMDSGSHGLGWCLGRGSSLPGARNDGEQPGSTLLPPEHLLAVQEPGRALEEGESREQTLMWCSPA